MNQALKICLKTYWMKLKALKSVKVLLRKHKENGDIEFAHIYFNSTTKTVVSSKNGLDKSFQKILHRIDNLVKNGSSCIMESIDGEYVNISLYSPL